MSAFLAALRAKVGNDLLMLPSVSGCVFDQAGRLLMARTATWACGPYPGVASIPTSGRSRPWCASCARSSASRWRCAG